MCCQDNTNFCLWLSAFCSHSYNVYWPGVHLNSLVTLLKLTGSHVSVLKMITCRFCSKTLQTLRGYVLHCRVHRNEPQCFFKCVGTNCKRTFCTYTAFKAHFYRIHNVPAATARAIVTDLKCAISLCAPISNSERTYIPLKRSYSGGATCGMSSNTL